MEPCSVCEEARDGVQCDAGHRLCRSCALACARTTEKLLGVQGEPPVCPCGDCAASVPPPGARAEAGAASAPSTPRLVKLEPGGTEYQEVLARFTASLRPTEVHGVYRVVNPPLLGLYEACRAQMDKRGKARETYVFHATTRAAAGSIVREGFNAHLAGLAHGTALGPGIYVATEAQTSHGYSKEDSVRLRAMFLCRALLGTAGKHSKPGPGMHVVFREQQVYPAYLLHYAS